MTQEQQWELILQHHNYPCFVADMDTYDLVYVNAEYMKLLPNTENVIGRKFFQVIRNDNVIDFEDIRLNWQDNDIIIRQLDNRRMNLSFQVEMTLLKDEKLVFGVLVPTKESKNIISHFEEAMTRCMDIFSQAPETMLHSFMEVLAEYYHAQRSYVYHFNFDENTINCVAEWNQDPAFHVTQEMGTKMDANLIIDWIQQENGNSNSIVLADSTEPDFDHQSTLAKIMTTFQVTNITLSTIEDSHHKLVGVVGISNRENFSHNFDTRLLSTVSKFVAQDVTKQSVDSTLFTLHHRDNLTGLHNRVAYARRTELFQHTPPKMLGVISVNINGLKNINNTLGNAAGDHHIKKSGLCLKSHFGYDFYRVSGDEFIGLACDVHKDEFEYKVATLQSELRKSNNYDFSMGSCWAEGKFEYTNLLREADNMMYINKQEYYALGVRTLESVSFVILRDLLGYLADDEFMIYLQPQVYLKDATLHGAEALIRRYDKTNKKMVFPDQFIAMYEQASVIRHVDLFVLDTVCQLLAKWVAKNQAIPISVNLSRVTLQEFGIVDTIVKICDKYHVPHELVVIEVTERVGLIENDVPSTLVKNFIDNGFTISLDDFGCAYSNIVTLAQIQVDEVKLDKSLVDNLTTNRKNHILVKNVLSMCEELEGMSTLAEGIEDQEQGQLLHELGCHLGQGYFYSRPIPVQEFEEKYIDHKGGTS